MAQIILFQTMWAKNNPNQTLSQQTTCILLKVPVTLGSRLIFCLPGAQQLNIHQRETCRSVKAWKLRCFCGFFSCRFFESYKNCGSYFHPFFVFTYPRKSLRCGKLEKYAVWMKMQPDSCFHTMTIIYLLSKSISNLKRQLTMIKRDQMQKEASLLLLLGRPSVLAKPLVPNCLDPLRRTLRHEAPWVGGVRRRWLLLLGILDHPHLIEHGRWVGRVWHLYANIVSRVLHLYANILGLFPVAEVWPLGLSGNIRCLGSRLELVSLVLEIVNKYYTLVNAVALTSDDFRCCLCRCCCAKSKTPLTMRNHLYPAIVQIHMTRCMVI